MSAPPINGCFMIEARARLQAIEECRHGAGRQRTVADLAAERLALAYAAARPLSPPAAAQLRGRRDGLLEVLIARRAQPPADAGARRADERRADERTGFGVCRSCQAPIRRLYVGRGHTIMPLDVIPVADGNVIVTGPDRCRVLGEDETTDEIRFLSHFETCPQADLHRRRRRTP